MSDTEQTTIPITRESKRAIHFKTEVLAMLQEVADVMNVARGEGFDVVFSVAQNPETKEHYINGDLVRITKSW